jgi:NAD(P)-dependent dehydrogenase (short-subunit alcohol dehydrogenase family)
VNSDMSSPTVRPCAATQSGIADFSAGLAQLLGERGIRVNGVAPGPVSGVRASGLIVKCRVLGRRLRVSGG